MQDTTAIDDKRVGILPWLDTQCKVLLKLSIKALLNMTRGYELAILAEEWRVVNREEHRHRRLVNGDRGQSFGVRKVADGVANLEALDTYKGANLATLNPLGLSLAEALEYHKLLNLGLVHRAITLSECYALSRSERATSNLAYGDTTHIGRILQRGDKHLHRAIDNLRLRNLVNDGVQKGCYRVGALRCHMRHPALLCRAVDGLVVKLFLGSA